MHLPLQHLSLIIEHVFPFLMHSGFSSSNKEHSPLYDLSSLVFMHLPLQHLSLIIEHVFPFLMHSGFSSSNKEHLPLYDLSSLVFMHLPLQHLSLLIEHVFPFLMHSGSFVALVGGGTRTHSPPHVQPQEHIHGNSSGHFSSGLFGSHSSPDLSFFVQVQVSDTILGPGSHIHG